MKEIEIEGRKVKALFDTGSFHTYIVSHNLNGAPVRELSVPYKVGLGGKAIVVKEYCLLEGKIDGHVFDAKASLVDSLGQVDGVKIDMIIGATTMEEWEITLNHRDGTLGLEGLKRREFTDF
ncbi:retroviral-like aspartic protease [bacterium]|nr:retroviral-like aspartic protease [bacterium]